MKALILCHRYLIPPGLDGLRKLAEKSPWKTEYDVARALRKFNIEVKFCGINKKLSPLIRAVNIFKPDFVFNLLEEYDGEARFESLVVFALEELNIKYTGCSANTLLTNRNKKAVNLIYSENHIHVPKVYEAAGKYPAIIKYATEHASLGIKKSSVVINEHQWRREVKRYNRNNNYPLIFEEFLPGREFCIGAICIDGKIIPFEPVETVFGIGKDAGDKILTEELKWNLKKRSRRRIFMRPLSKRERRLREDILKITINACKISKIDGYARLDIRTDENHIPHIIDMNPNPDVGWNYDFCESARLAGISYEKLISLCVRTAFKTKMLSRQLSLPKLF